MLSEVKITTAEYKERRMKKEKREKIGLLDWLWKIYQIWEATYLPAYLAFKLNKNQRSITFVCTLAKATFLLLSLEASRAIWYSSQAVVHRRLIPFLLSNSTKTPSNLTNYNQIYVSVIRAEGVAPRTPKSTYNNIKSYAVWVTFYKIYTSLGTTELENYIICNTDSIGENYI